MARKRERVYHLMSNGERQITAGLYRVGVMSEVDARKHFDKISDKRWKGMIKSGFIEKKGKYIFLGKVGKVYCENKLEMKYQYRTRVDHVKHDLKLSKMYLKLSSKQRDTWKTETQIRHELLPQSKYQDMINDSKYENTRRKNFIPDATIYSKLIGQEVVLEAVTKFYSEQDINMKKETAHRFYNGNIYIF